MCVFLGAGVDEPAGLVRRPARHGIHATHWDDVVTKLGCEHLRRHDIRHTGLTWFADAGFQVHVLRRITGHGSLATTRRYLHPDVNKIRAAGAALSAHLSVLRAPRSLPGPIVMTR
ncbi:tyrosine-type recombinase/integrase [Streptomyces sp. BE133]|uniref:tyrosine-type recombinase/integrase n=1 Tax=Streptomyces sp. BE133 TaxID=3002523 RepID=UPI002E7D68C7|nr:tyrosine-type recombinase/integrase [Streptomyces sp. BE133]